MPSLGSEAATVQNPLIKYTVEIGWSYLSQQEALTARKGASGTLLYSVLREKLIALNPGVVTVDNVDSIISRIESARNNIEGNAEVLAWIRGERTVYVESEKRQRNVCVVDFDHPNNNNFHVTDEWEYTNGQFTNRADVMFCINGIPVKLDETKSARKKDGIDEGMTQVRRYHRETPEMLTAPQLFNVVNIIDFYYGTTWSLERKNLFNWKDEEPGNFEKKVKRFFARERFLKMLGEWIVFFKKDDELKKAVLRQHQTRAVEKVVERALDPEKKRGLVWHTQGSGKTFTMIKAAQQILNNPAFGKPTVIMLVDRNELEGQLSGWIASLLGHEKAEIARSRQHLRELLKSDYRGLIVSMIHKFDRADANLSERENIFILVDEAHRTTGGDLGNFLVAALPKATMIGFTGTPIDKTAYGKGTFKTFGADDAPKGYLDKYSISESIQDGTTLPLNYTLAPNDIRVPREQLEKEFLELAETQGISDIDELNKILDRAINLKTFLKAADRVDKVARFVAVHFKENVEPLGYKAFLVGVDREACAIYKQALDKYLPPEYSRVVYTSAHNDSEVLAAHKLSEDDEKRVRKAFAKRSLLTQKLTLSKEAQKYVETRTPDLRYEAETGELLILGQLTREDAQKLEQFVGAAEAGAVRALFEEYTKRLPKILIVTEKLLTGFDAPILYCMYLDKPMRDHTLLQAIARVNRPYEDDGGIKKPSGFVLDFVGIFEKLEKALSFDSDEVSSVIQNLDVLKHRFEVVMTEQAPPYLALCKGQIDDKAVERAIDTFQDKERREEFYKCFKELEALYEIISPDPFLRPYVEDYGKLSVLYQIVLNAFSKRTMLIKDLMQKTEELVKKHATTTGLTTTLPMVKIDEKTLKALKDSDSSDNSKVINLGKSILTTIAEEGKHDPYLIPIGERTEAILEAYDDRQVTTQDALKSLEKLLNEYVQAKKERQQAGFDGNTFTLYWVLKQASISKADELAPSLEKAFQRYANYKDNPAELRQLKAELYKVLLPTVGKDKMVDLADRILRLQRK